ncbi:lmo0937 family membrane protein [Paenisporosarcina sp. TG20]|uniref:lmo0937 family membrane protein n=1 Tax=Paenisporosarcina sp. TG20 TaxID=1211706 RepID=UPI00031D427A|nr:lmo0937 family membrane protein [Paenisporosarcina sp. TG20]
MGKLIWMVIVVLLVIWLLGIVLKIGGALIHLILLIAGIVLIIQLITGKRKL